MPSATYEQLLADVLPTRIQTQQDYDAIRFRLGDLLVKQMRTKAEEQLFQLLALLVEDYDRRHALPPDAGTPAEMLCFLVEHSGKKADELLKPIFGQRSHVHEALTGKRKISAEQARKLGKMFHVNPGLFV